MKTLEELSNIRGGKITFYRGSEGIVYTVTVHVGDGGGGYWDGNWQVIGGT